jgi:uncharacterized protein (TIGR03435 family)
MSFARPFTTLATVLAISAQTPSAAKFEVASIHRHVDGGPNVSGGLTAANGTYRAIRASLKYQIQFAYKIRDFQIFGGPAWLQSEWYDTVAKAAGLVTEDEMRPMVQSLLAERFQLRCHWEKKEQPIYELVLAKGGSKLRKSSPDASAGMRMTASIRVSLVDPAMTLDDLADWLSSAANHPVVNRTGLDGKYEIDLKYTTDQSITELPTLFTALQEQLGLRLESHRGPVHVLMIDHAERPSEN